MNFDTFSPFLINYLYLETLFHFSWSSTFLSEIYWFQEISWKVASLATAPLIEGEAFFLLVSSSQHPISLLMGSEAFFYFFIYLLFFLFFLLFTFFFFNLFIYLFLFILYSYFYSFFLLLLLYIYIFYFFGFLEDTIEKIYPQLTRPFSTSRSDHSYHNSCVACLACVIQHLRCLQGSQLSVSTVCLQR